jgi:hypothetical protein
MSDAPHLELPCDSSPTVTLKTDALNHSATHPALLRARDTALAEALEKAVGAFAVAAKLEHVLRGSLLKRCCTCACHNSHPLRSFVNWTAINVV